MHCITSNSRSVPDRLYTATNGDSNRINCMAILRIVCRHICLFYYNSNSKACYINFPCGRGPKTKHRNMDQSNNTQLTSCMYTVY